MKNANIKFIFGIILIICGWIICFDVFLLLIGLAFFLLGTILVLFSGKTLLIKSVVILIPILLWFIGFEIILHAINKPTSLTILIPENFSGEFRIIEGEKNGVAPTEEKGRTTVQIPENGILITQAHFNLRAFSDFEFYYVNASGNRTKLNFFAIDQKTPDFPAVKFNGVLSPPTPPGQSSDVPRKLDYLYDSFEVFSADTEAKPITDRIDTAKLNRQQRYDVMTDSLVKIERGIK
ncbi:MAG TPA: hypothetical protein VFJ43_14755 [Bacteroidia bacterium]|nr:hypothetical protein [Bacteroidia bacterium]